MTKLLMRARLTLLLLTFGWCTPCFAQYITLSGKVTDANNRAISFVSVYVQNNAVGTTTNEAGFYRLKLTPGTYYLIFRIMGHAPETDTLLLTAKETIFNVRLKLDTVQFEQSNSDSALNIIRHTIAQRKSNREEIPAYSADVYNKAEQRLLNAPKMLFKRDISQKLNLDSNRQGIINLTESLSEFNFQQPDKVRQFVNVSKYAPYGNVFNFNSASDLQIDWSKNYMRWEGMCDHTFISPIATEAPHFYTYKLIKRFKDGVHDIDEIAVIPKHYSEHLFSGTICIVDQIWKLYATNLHLYPSAHIDFIDSIGIKQQYVEVKPTAWLPQTLKFSFNGGLFGFKYGGYFLNIYNHFKTDTVFAADYFNGEILQVPKEAYSYDETFWNEYRPVPLLDDEATYYRLTVTATKNRNEQTLIDSIQNTNNTFKPLEFFFNGYTLHNYKQHSWWDFPAPQRIWFFNTVEGYGLDINPRYTKTYSNHRSLSISPDVRYGSSNKILNGNVGATYFYNPFHQATIYLNVGSNFLDLNNTGTVTPFINSLSTLLLGNNLIKLYQSKFISAGTDGEVRNGILLNGSLEYSSRRSLINTVTSTFNKDSVYLTSNNPFDPYGTTPLFPNYRAFIFKGSATFTFNQQYEINPNGKFIKFTKYPRVRFNYRMGLPVFNTDANFNFASVDVFQDKLQMGIMGYSSYFLSAGKFLTHGNIYYPDFYQFSGGQSFFFNPSLGSFHFLNFYTYSTDKAYFEAHLEHNFAGLLLSHLAVLNNLNIQEIIGGSFLSQGKLPDYKEFYVGLRRAVVRLDYGFAFGKYSSYHGLRFMYNF